MITLPPPLLIIGQQIIQYRSLSGACNELYHHSEKYVDFGIIKWYFGIFVVLYIWYYKWTLILILILLFIFLPFFIAYLDNSCFLTDKFFQIHRGSGLQHIIGYKSDLQCFACQIFWTKAKARSRISSEARRISPRSAENQRLSRVRARVTEWWRRGYIR